jgi:hypothetical protein
MSAKINRRTLLRGAGGIAIALPFLNVMNEREAHAAPGPQRFAVLFNGQSLGGDECVLNYFLPTKTGRSYPLSVSLAPLGQWGLQDSITLASGLSIPIGSGPGQRDATFHADAHHPQMTGVANTRSGEGADQVVTRVVGAGSKFKSIHTIAQANPYRGEYYRRDVLTYGKDAGGAVFDIQNESSPEKMFTKLFTGFGMNVDPKILAELERRKSILDFVSGSRASLR